ncbi:MAG: BglG family transcription antiterminator LicT [Sarcina sp.]
MKIEKILNNNVILSTDPKTKKEIILMGCGIAFGKKNGEIIDSEKVDKTFIIDDKKIGDKIKLLIEQIPNGIFQLAQEIILYSEKSLNKKLDKQIYISLADHIAFAIKRYKSGIEIKNTLYNEIKMVHPEELKLGIWGLEHINKRAKINLPIDEAGFIALHLVNASYKYNVTESQTILSLTSGILDIIKNNFNIEFCEEDISYSRLVTHLKFFAKRIIDNQGVKSSENDFIDIVKEKYEKSYLCSVKIRKYINENFEYKVSDDEIVYLTMHIERVMMAIK